MKDKDYEKHEAMCERCGRCCLVKIQWFDLSIRTGDHCEFYDREKKECMCYEQRFSVNPRCRTVLQAIMEGGLPPDCPYVRDFPGYITPIKWKERSDEKASGVQSSTVEDSETAGSQQESSGSNPSERHTEGVSGSEESESKA